MVSTAELLKKVRKIELLAKGKSREVMTGAYHSAFRGRGMTFSDSREYQPGDDVRDIDWNVTARTHIPHIKLFEEEKELTVIMIIDTSASGFFGSPASRIQYIAEICALLSYNAIREQNRLGAIFFSSGVDLYLSPAKGKKQMLRIIRELVACTPGQGGSGLESALKFLSATQSKRTVCFLLSDFIQDHYQTPLTLAARKHDILPLRVWDTLEKETPAAGLIRFFDAEQKRWIWFDSSDNHEVNDWRNYFRRYEIAFEQSLLAAGIKGLSLQNGSDYLPALLKFFKKKMRLAFVVGFLVVCSSTKSQTFVVKPDTIAIGEKCEISWTSEAANQGRVKKLWWRGISKNGINKDTTPSPPDMEWLEGPNPGFRFAEDTLLLEGHTMGTASFRFFDGGHFALADNESVFAHIIVKAPAIPEGDITDIMDIETFASSQSVIKRMFWWGLGLLAVLLMYLLHKRKKKDPPSSNDTTDPLKINLSIDQRLGEIMQHRGNDQKLQWATDELASVVRQYGAEKFGLNAWEMTSTELIKEIKKINAGREEADQLNYIIRLTDQVKFAKAPIQWGLIEEMCQILKSLNKAQVE